MSDDYKTIKHMVLVLKTLREVSRAIANNSEVESLCNSICHILIERRGYYNAWIILTKNGKPIQPYYHTGINYDFQEMTDFLDKGNIPQCGLLSMESDKVIVLENPIQDCGECPLKKFYSGKSGFAQQLKRGNLILGWITVSIPSEFVKDEEEILLFSEMVNDFSLALENILRKKQNQQLEKNYKAILNSTSESIIEINTDGDVLYQNEKAKNLFSLNSDKNNKKSIYQLFPEDQKDLIESAINNTIFKKFYIITSKVKLINKKKMIDVELTLNWNNLNNDQIIAMIRILTDREKAFQYLQDSEERFKLLFDKAPLSYQSLDENGDFIDVNQAWLDLMLYKKEEVIGHWFGEFLHPDYIEHFKTRFPLFKKLGKIHSEFYMKNKKGEDLYISFEGRIAHKSDGSFRQTHCILSDTTEKKNAEKRLIESEAYFRNIFDNINTGVAVYEPVDDGENFIIKDLNMAGQKISNVSINKVRDRKVTDVFPGIKDLGLFQVFQDVYRSGVSQYHPISQYRDQHVKMWIDNHVSRTLSGNILTLYDDRSKQKILEDKIRHFERMELIGQLASGIAHDFNNALSGIMGAAQLLKLPQRNLDEKSLKYTNMILEASDRASDLSSRLLSFSRKKQVELAPVKLHKLINESKEILKSTIDKKISVICDFSAENSVILGNESDLHNLILNLSINASHAMATGGKLILRTKNTKLNQEFCEFSKFNIYPGEYCCLEVVDTGCGVPSDNLTKIFEPFFTTKEQGSGTGLGLSAVYATVQSHNGAIEVASTLGEGSTFKIYLPITDESTTSVNRDLLLTGKGLLLLVDDEEINRFLGKEILESIGYSVVLASNGLEALEIYKLSQNKIKLVLLDMIMPIMNGKDAFLKLKELNKNCKVIVATGYSDSMDIIQLREMGLSAVIQKPYKMSEISKIIHDVLNE